MRTRFRLSGVLAVAVLSLPISMLGQYAGFQQPTTEELSITAEPKDPGAAAIYLYREETVDDNLHYHSFAARIKVLTEKGKELATVEVPYGKTKFQVSDIKARTIHADGKIIPLDVKPTDLVEQKGEGFQINKMVFTLPSVEVGSILEYRWQLRYDDNTLSSPYWDIQQPYFVRKAHYSFLPFRYMGNVTDGKGNAANKLMYSFNLPTDVKVNADASGRYSLDIENVPAIPKEGYMPPMQTLLREVKFYYTRYSTSEDFWKHEGSDWSKEMDRFASESKGLKEAVDKIVAPTDSEDVKAQKIYDALMALDNTDFTRRKSKAELKKEGLKQIKNAEDVWKQKSGSSDEIALLYLAMARIAHLKAYAMVLCNRNREEFNPYYMSMSQLDDVLVVVVVNGKEVALDPGQKFAAYGQLAWKHTMAGGLRQSDKGVVMVQTHANNYKEALTMRIADVTIARDGSVTGSGRILMSGPAALLWRHRAIENDEDELKKQFNEHLKHEVPEGVTAEFDHFLGLDDYHAQLMAVIKISGNMGNSTGKRVFIPSEFYAARGSHPFVDEKTRITPIDMEYADDVHDEVTYHLPEGLSVESAPPDTSIPWAGHAVFHVSSKVGKDQVEVARTFARAFAILPAKEYNDLRDFYQKVATADQQQLVLTTTKPETAKTDPAKTGGGN